MTDKKDNDFLLYSLGSDDDDGVGDDMVYSSLLASSDSNAFVSDDDEAEDTHHKAVHEVPHDVAPVPQWRMATIALWQFGYAALMGFIMGILLPLQTLEMVGKENKGIALGVSVALATVIATIVSLASGQVSDHISTPLGKRTPFVVVGSAGLALSAVALSWYGAAGLTGAGVYVVYAGLLVVMRTCAGVAETAFQPLLPDLVPKHQMGTVSGWWAMGQMFGNLFGPAGAPLVMDQIGPLAVAIIISSILTLGTLAATIANREKPPASKAYTTSPAPDSQNECVRWPALRFLARYIKPFLISSNFRWIFVTRFVTQLGWGFINNFVFYFINDVSPRPYRLFGLEFTKTNEAVGIFVGTIMLTAVFSGYAGGALGDRFGRKRMVYASSAFQTLSCVGFVLFTVWPQQFIFLLICAVLIGIGLGSFIAVDFALATECLPSEESRGTDLAVWGLASSLPIAFSGPLGGLMLDNGQRVGHVLDLPNLGYLSLFASCGLLLALSAFFVRRITVGNPVRRRKPTNELDLELVEMEDDDTCQ